MKQYILITVASAVALLTTSRLVWWWQMQSVSAEPEITEVRYDISRSISFSFTLKNTTNRALQDVDFWTYAPVKQTATQRCCINLSASHPYYMESDERGNQVIHFTFAEFPPYTSRLVRITAELKLAERSNPMRVGDLSGFLTHERFIERDHPEIRKTAQRLAAASPQKTAQNIFEWVADNLHYAGYVREDRGALYALQHRQGDCTEYMYLFIALARANGIPARAVGGYVYGASTVARASDYHNWAEVYLDGAWRIVDPQKRRFMERQADYIAMQLLTDPSKRGAAAAHRFWYSGEGLQVRMN